MSIWLPGTLYQPGHVVVPTAVSVGAATAPGNPAFASGDTGWTKGTGWAITDAAAFSDTYSAANTSTGDDLALVNDTKADVTPGQSLTARCMVRGSGSSDDTGAVFLRWYTSADVLISDSVGTYTGGSTTWKESRVTATAPATAAKVSIGCIAQKGTTSALRADTFTWNHVAPGSAPEFAFKAIQADAGLSGATEPTWPTVLGNTVVDGEVTWEAIAARTVTWQASPVMVSGATEPVWPIEGDAFVADGTIAWKAVPFRITDENCPNTPVVAIAASKVFAAGSGVGDIVRFSATLDPRDWTTTQDAGFLPTGMHQIGQVGVTAMGVYRGNLCVWSPDGFQMWQVDPDPAAMALLDSMEGIGSSFPHAVQPVSNDLFFLSTLGVRSVGLTAGSGHLQAGDVGMPVDVLVQAAVDGKAPLSTFYASAGQFWLSTAREPPVPVDPPLVMACPLLDGGLIGVAYSYTPDGPGIEGVTYSVDGTLPPGLELDPVTGAITGTPTTEGDYEFGLVVSLDGYQSFTCFHTFGVMDPGLVAVSNDEVRVSTDGVTWRAATVSVTDGQGVGSSEGVVIVVGAGGMISRSTDGESFTAVSNALTDDIFRVRFLGNRWYATSTGLSDLMASDDDGLTWEVVGGAEWPLNFIDYGGGVYLAGHAGDGLLVSSDGESWSEGTTLPALHTCVCLAFGASNFVVGCNAGAILTTTNGTGFTSRLVQTSGILGSANVLAIAYANETFVVGTADGKLAKSTDDGETWALVTIDVGGLEIRDVQYLYGHWYVVGGSAGGEQAFMQRSANLVDWTTITHGFATSDRIEGICAR